MKNTVTVTLNNSAYVLTEQVISLQVNKQFNRIPNAEMALVTGDFSERNYPLFDEQQFALGESIDIYIRYEEPGSKDRLLFSGIITARIAEVQNKLPVLRLVLQDPAIRMRDAIATRLYSDKSDDEIIKQILKDYPGVSLASQAASKLNQFRFDQLVQKQCSDWSFVLRQIAANGFLTQLDNGELSVQDLSASSKKSLKLDLGIDQSVLDFSLCESGSRLYQSVAIEYWDQLKNKFDRVEKKFNDKAAKQIKAVNSNLIFPQITSKKQALSALGYFELQQELNLNSGKVTITGNADVDLGQQLILSRFPGIKETSFTVTGIYHKLKSGQWITQLQIGQINSPLINQQQTGQPFEQGSLVIESATVEKWQADPLKLGRIAVKVPAFGKGTYWAYCGQFTAGKKQGSYFPPQQGDLVYIGFINNNPALGVILTSVYSSQDSLPTPFKSAEDSPIGIVWGEFSFVFDQKNKLFQLKTGEKNKLTFSQSKGVSIDTKQELDISCGAKAKISATSTMNIKGQVVNLN